MAKRILVPLDGSAFTETLLDVVADAARGAGAAVRLVHVAPQPDNRLSPEGRVVAYSDQEMSRLEAEGLDYLRGLEPRLAGLGTECVVRFGKPVAEILDEAEAWGADLIAVTTAGRSGLGRTVLGSVAEEVFRRARIPVILYHPSTGTA